MAEEIIDPFETVEIDQMQGEEIVAPPRPRDQGAHPLMQQHAVGQAGQLVVMGEVAQPRFHFLARGNVERRSQDAANDAANILERGFQRQKGALGPRTIGKFFLKTGKRFAC